MKELKMYERLKAGGIPFKSQGDLPGAKNPPVIDEDREEDFWSREFNVLGTEGVRREIASARWSNEKIAAARHWLQREDVRVWESEGQADSQSPSSKLRNWAQYAVTGVALLYAAMRLVRLMRYGV